MKWYPPAKIFQHSRHYCRCDHLFSSVLGVPLYRSFDPVTNNGRYTLETSLGLRSPGGQTVLFPTWRFGKLIATPRVLREQFALEGKGSGTASAAQVPEVASATLTSGSLRPQALEQRGIPPNL